MKLFSRAFTLIELLVVIAVIAILAAILFPVFARAKAAAKKTTGISNARQIAQAMHIYLSDNDDGLPLVRQMEAGTFYGPNETTWKDAIVTYAKSGGRPFNGGKAYKERGTDGIFTTPANESAWGTGESHEISTSIAGPGDETTRYPRGFAVNADAGKNEGGGKEIWPWSNGGVVHNPGASATVLERPADTFMLVDSRISFPDAHRWYATWRCSVNGENFHLDDAKSSLSCLVSHVGKVMIVAYFDGHAGSSKPAKAIALGNWGDDVSDKFDQTDLPSLAQHPDWK